ncbi:glycosyltransferase family 4 protein [Candidatus Nitronereus thalassa]|uniref:Glycosyltransferase family 4 protein n=1 Tax=Candidatus Nitronereus thalassa TaxID=3020898 RepID=A0ABU3K586_9BACT|nr:glycosyltransferase family 4 protein [Candidatus Nitronereus thalassa]MDT7041567.1 glycosyltransferase family 4 protein [Candidatus Nitronereus thalassa]
MNVLIVAPWDQEFGGVVSVVRNLATEIQKSGHNLLCFHPGKEIWFKPQTTKLGFFGYRGSLGGNVGNENFILRKLILIFLFPIRLFQLIKIIKDHDVNIINIHYPVSGFFYFAICRWLLPLRLVVSAHGADLFPKGERRRTYPLGLKIILKAADLVVTPSQAFKNDVVKLFPFLQEKTRFIHNGLCSLELLNFEVSQGAKHAVAYVLCIAAHNQKKGLDVLIRAWKDITDAVDPIKLFLVGEGPLSEQLKDLVVSLGLQDQVIFLGSKGRKDVAQLLHGCQAFVLPSRSEPFGIVIIEAMACKKAVVATNVGGVPEIIENGHNGVLVEPDNSFELGRALLSVLENPELRNTISQNGYASVMERFLSKNTGMKYETYFKELIRDVA